MNLKDLKVVEKEVKALVEQTEGEIIEELNEEDYEVSSDDEDILRALKLLDLASAVLTLIKSPALRSAMTVTGWRETLRVHKEIQEFLNTWDMENLDLEENEEAVYRHLPTAVTLSKGVR